jgi:hypothetical protein
MAGLTPADVLKALLLGEQASMAGRLLESTLFVPHLGVKASLAVRAVADATVEHCQWLAEAIIETGDSPSPAMPDVRSGDLHFQDVSFILARLADDIQRRFNACAKGAQHLSGAPQAAALVARVMERYSAHLAIIREVRFGNSARVSA